MTAATAEQRLGRNQWWLVLGLTVVVAATRFMAVAHSMWDWDEALFALSLHNYNVAAHHPHPPGFPLYAGLGRVVRTWLIHDDFRALRTIQLVASMLAFPAMFALGRAMRFTFNVALSAALLFVFLPNVWSFGGTAFSDIFNIVVLIGALALLFDVAHAAGVPAPEAQANWKFVSGTALFSLSLLVRPQNVLSCYPWFSAAWQRWRARRHAEVIAAAVLSIAIVAGGYGIAAKATGFADYVTAIRNHQHYVASVDGYENVDRPPSLELFPKFAVNPWGAGRVAIVLFVLAVIGAFFGRRPEAEACATFLPFLVFALFMLNPQFAGRLSLGIMPLVAILAAAGIGEVARRIAAPPLRAPVIAAVIQFICVAVIAARLATWLSPALRNVRRLDSPPVQAMRWVKENVAPGRTVIVHPSLAPMGEYYLAAYDVRVAGDAEVRKMPPMRDTWYVGDGPSNDGSAINFHRDRAKLFAIFDGRYFEAHVRPMTGTIRYTTGWYDEEASGDHMWRWMGRRGSLVLQPIVSGGELRFTAFFPIDHEAPPEVVVTIDGREVDRFTPHATIVSRAYRIGASAAEHEIVLAVSNAVNPARQHLAGDDRDLGLQLRAIAWQP